MFVFFKKVLTVKKKLFFNFMRKAKERYIIQGSTINSFSNIYFINIKLA
jgi:hypothetical protein